MRDIHTVVIHYSATYPSDNHDIDDITVWHKERGMFGPGYHFIIKTDGVIQFGRPLDKVGAHVKGHNTGTIGICYIGGLVGHDEGGDTRTDEQKYALRWLIAALSTTLQKPLKVVGHRDLAATQCPGFDVQNETWPMTLQEI